MQEAQAIVNQTEKDKDKLSIFAIRNEIKSILESAYQEVSINPRRFSSGIVMKLLLSDFLNKDEKRERYLKFYNLFIHNIEQFTSLAKIAIPEFLTMHTLDENAKKQCFLNFFEIAYKNAQKNGEEAIIWWRFTLPNLCRGDDLPAEEMRETYFKFLELSIHNARQLITSKNRSAQGWISQWVAKVLPKLIKSPILYQEQQQELLALVPEQKYFGSDIYDYRYNFLHSPQKKKENLNTLLANLQQTDQSDPYSKAKEKTDLIFEFTTHAQEHPNFESLKNIKSNILEVLKTYPSPLTADDIIFINNKGVNAFLYTKGLKKLPKDCTQKDLIDILNFYKADTPGWEKFKIQKNYICNKKFYHSDSDFEKIFKNPEKLQKIFDLLMIGEKDCKDQTRFWTVLVPKILEKINDKKIEEDVNLLKDFINKLDISIDNREKMRIFIAYYFDTKRYQDYPKDSIQQAHLMINGS